MTQNGRFACSQIPGQNIGFRRLGDYMEAPTIKKTARRVARRAVANLFRNRFGNNNLIR